MEFCSTQQRMLTVHSQCKQWTQVIAHPSSAFRGTCLFLGLQLRIVATATLLYEVNYS